MAQFKKQQQKTQAPQKKKVKSELTDDQKQEIKEAFDLFDTDRSGAIDCHEIKVILRALGFEVKKQEVQALMKEYDRDETGRIEYSDYIELMTRKYCERDPQDEIFRAFKLFDDDNSGKITLRKLKKVSKELGESLSDQELQAMIDEFDKDGDGQINIDEFLSIMKQTTIY
ncbi:unnamed protein product (macronuclear) [Paramecium tetraurelia]|uniref:Basal body centrin3b n=2 Tax=Paramecium TaxID=5884 RepID=Q3SEJ1_PARTE|nr:uncharacterized protein GSPATT00011829001 [Paramecium tetraurelia]CAD8155826.1 unnamed protein product [Paramecium octaurelia]CAI38933.1 basal body centrin3b [Paramecium tetraurelia]CAK76256.1 unnamed protein product [Paramecium tetraurelia]|eukprot:XP_001443653.1 hypothetical protein (macronuclear) [Paramecium tetraurelia strain d4-2]